MSSSCRSVRLAAISVVVGRVLTGAVTSYADPSQSPSAGAPESAPEESDKSSGKTDITRISLDDMLRDELAGDSSGSFGYRLRKYGITPYMHGMVAADWAWRKANQNEHPTNSFRLRDFDMYFGADVLDLFVPEVYLELQPPKSKSVTIQNSNDATDFAPRFRYAQLDFKLCRNLVILRAGQFLIPFGVFNTNQFPRFISKLPDRAKIFREIIPTPWADIGVQIHGKWEWVQGRSISYAAYVVNGIQQVNTATDGTVSEGGHISDFRIAFNDQNTNKALGFRAGVEPLRGVTLGLSGYSGAYSVDGRRKLNMGDVDLGVHRGNFSFEAEAAIARQELTGGALIKKGYSALVAYRMLEAFEPVLSVEGVLLAGSGHADTTTGWIGLNFFPLPERVPTAVVRSATGIEAHRTDARIALSFLLELALGF